jgi:hypothetical protein
VQRVSPSLPIAAVGPGFHAAPTRGALPLGSGPLDAWCLVPHDHKGRARLCVRVPRQWLSRSKTEPSFSLDDGKGGATLPVARSIGRGRCVVCQCWACANPFQHRPPK